MAERQIYLVRHGVAEDISSTGADFDRALTSGGVRKMHAAATGLRTIGAQPGILVASPYRRAQETAAVLADVLAPGQRETWDELGCGVEPRAVLAKIAGLDPREDVMLVGHEPDMGVLLSLFLTGNTDGFWTHFSKGAVACISGANLPPQGRARLEWFERATVLGRVGA